MTTDPFTEAARAEAERQNPVPTAYRPDGPSQWERLLAQQAFRNGATWARTHLTAQEPTEAEVEAAARALHIAQLDGDPFAGDAWDEQPHHAPRKAWLRDLAHAALRGARTARRDEEKR